MPGLIREEPFRTITVKELHPTFAAEVEGVHFPNPSEEQFQEILAAMAKYGVCVFRKTGMDDVAHISFSKRFGDLDDLKPYLKDGRKLRYSFVELFDAANIDEDGSVVAVDSPRAMFSKGNTLFHIDSSFNPRRASFSILKATELPPPGNGGNTDFADSRTAYDELPPELRDELLQNDYAAAHSIGWSRKVASPEYFKDMDVESTKMHAHKLVQRHEPSGRMNIYVAAHAHHVVDVGEEKSKELLETLMEHVSQDKYVTSIEWKNSTDVIIWDNRCILHRANGGSFEGKYRRDLRRTTVHDDSPTAWGLNERMDNRQGFVHLLEKKPGAAQE